MRLMNSILCEDIRREIGNKYSLMGILDENLIFNEPEALIDNWPKIRPLGIYFKFEADTNEEVKKIAYVVISTKSHKHEKKEIAKLEIKKELLTNKFRIFASISNFLFDATGDLIFSAQFLDNNNQLIAELDEIYNLKVEVVPIGS